MQTLKKQINIASHIKSKTKMKVKNLLLAGLAVAAMTACSNDIESIDNVTPPTTKDASMQFGIVLPQNTGTRAGAGDGIVDGEKETGIPVENAFTDITVVIDYSPTSREVLNFKYADFKESQGNDKTMLYLKESIPVKVGTATVSAFVNASDALKNNLKTDALSALKAEANYASSIDDLSKAGGIAEANKFLMSGTKADQEFTEGEEPTPVNVPVNRVAAKLVERSTTEAFLIEKPASAAASDLKITLQNYNFANLLQDTYVLESNSIIASGLFNQYLSAATTPWTNYLTPKAITGPTAADITTNITYCTENKTTTNTLVLYKAVATWGDKAASTFYVAPDKTVFFTFDELAKVYDMTGMSDNSSIQDFAAKGIKKYDGGVCYYKSDAIGNIVRNNVYYLDVTSIADLGDPTPGETVNPSTIDLTVEMNPWTINVIDIKL